MRLVERIIARKDERLSIFPPFQKLWKEAAILLDFRMQAVILRAISMDVDPGSAFTSAGDVRTGILKEEPYDSVANQTFNQKGGTKRSGHFYPKEFYTVITRLSKGQRS